MREYTSPYLRAKRNYLYYPNCHLSAETALDLLTAKFDMVNYFIGRNQTRNGKKELHVYMETRGAPGVQTAEDLTLNFEGQDFPGSGQRAVPKREVLLGLLKLVGQDYLKSPFLKLPKERTFKLGESSSRKKSR